jgi:REP element-mobilizing transposase RayT
MGHAQANLLIHVIFSTKGRRPLIGPDYAERLHKYFYGLGPKEFGKVLKVGGTEDHIHGLISIRSNVDVAHAMNRWKSLSSGWIHKTFPGMRDFAWQSGYGAFSVSQSLKNRVMAYIDGQVKHQKRRSFQAEFIDFLKRHEVEFDPAHVWD